MSDWIEKAKDFVKGHPEQAKQGLDKVEDLLNERTGGKYADRIDQGSDKLKESLGLPPDEEATLPPTPSPEPGPTPSPSPTPAPSPAPTPTPEPGPAPTPEPAPAEPMPPVDPTDPTPVDPTLPGGPGPSEIPPTGEPAGEQDLPGAPSVGQPQQGTERIVLGDPPPDQH